MLRLCGRNVPGGSRTQGETSMARDKQVREK